MSGLMFGIYLYGGFVAFLLGLTAEQGSPVDKAWRAVADRVGAVLAWVIRSP